MGICLNEAPSKNNLINPKYVSEETTHLHHYLVSSLAKTVCAPSIFTLSAQKPHHISRVHIKEQGPFHLF